MLQQFPHIDHVQQLILLLFTVKKFSERKRPFLKAQY